MYLPLKDRKLMLRQPKTPQLHQIQYHKKKLREVHKQIKHYKEPDN